MDTKQLEYLLDLRSTMSMSKTAEHYYTTHQSVNNVVKSLERELRVTLLERTHRGCFLTEAGRLVCDYAQDFLEKKIVLQQALTVYNDSVLPNLSGQLDIYIISRFANKIFLKFYTEYCRKNPKLSINLKTLTASIFLSLLPINTPFIFLASLSDSTLFSKNFYQQYKQNQLLYKIVKQYPLGFVVTSNSKWREIIMTATRLYETEIPVVVFNYAIDEMSLLTSNDFKYFLVDNWEAQKQMIKSGDYVGICTAFEYKQYFQMKDQSLLFISDSCLLSHHDFYYVGFYAEQFQNELVVQDFLTALEKYYR